MLVYKSKSCKATSACAAQEDSNGLRIFGSTPLWGMRYLKAQKVPRTSVSVGVVKHDATVPVQSGIQKGSNNT